MCLILHQSEEQSLVEGKPCSPHSTALELLFARSRASSVLITACLACRARHKELLLRYLDLATLLLKVPSSCPGCRCSASLRPASSLPGSPLRSSNVLATLQTCLIIQPARAPPPVSHPSQPRKPGSDKIQLAFRPPLFRE